MRMSMAGGIGFELAREEAVMYLHQCTPSQREKRRTDVRYSGWHGHRMQMLFMVGGMASSVVRRVMSGMRAHDGQ